MKQRAAGQALVDAMGNVSPPVHAGRVEFTPPAVNPWLAAAGGGGATAAAFWGALALMSNEEEERKQRAVKEAQLPLQ